jgi:hypothetical protein
VATSDDHKIERKKNATEDRRPRIENRSYKVQQQQQKSRKEGRKAVTYLVVLSHEAPVLVAQRGDFGLEHVELREDALM